MPSELTRRKGTYLFYYESNTIKKLNIKLGAMVWVCPQKSWISLCVNVQVLEHKRLSLVGSYWGMLPSKVK